MRESQEETGIDISEYLKTSPYKDCVRIPAPDFFLEEPIPAHNSIPEHFHLDLMYIVHIPYQNVIKKEDKAHDIGWFTWEETQKLDLFESTKLFIKEVLK